MRCGFCGDGCFGVLCGDAAVHIAFRVLYLIRECPERAPFTSPPNGCHGLLVNPSPREPCDW